MKCTSCCRSRWCYHTKSMHKFVVLAIASLVHAHLQRPEVVCSELCEHLLLAEAVRNAAQPYLALVPRVHCWAGRQCKQTRSCVCNTQIEFEMLHELQARCHSRWHELQDQCKLHSLMHVSMIHEGMVFTLLTTSAKEVAHTESPNKQILNEFCVQAL